MKSTIALVGGIVAVSVIVKLYEKYNDKMIDMKKSKVLMYKSIGIALWPAVFTFLIPRQDQTRQTILPFLWPVIIWMCDVYLIMFGTPQPPYDVAMMRIEPTTVSSMAFALYGFVGGNMMHERSHVFMYSILACIAFAFPSHNLTPGSEEEVIVETFQRSITSMCMGLIFTGVAINHASNNCKNE